MDEQQQPTATVQANPIEGRQLTRRVGTRGRGVHRIGEGLNGFEKYLPEPSPPPKEKTAAEIAADREQSDREFQQHLIDAAAARKRHLAEFRESAPHSLASATLATYQAASPIQKEVIKRLKEYLARSVLDEPQNLVFFGPVGTGKDHLAVAVAAEEINGGSSVVWLNVQDWFGSLRDRIGEEDSVSEHREILRLASPDILVLSEVLPPFGSAGQYMATMLYRVVEKRTAEGSRTFATLNAATDAEAAERMGRPTWDRLCDNAGKIFCNWPSYRAPAWKVNC
jgi:DNA replication protein DnaC